MWKAPAAHAFGPAPDRALPAAPDWSYSALESAIAWRSPERVHLCPLALGSRSRSFRTPARLFARSRRPAQTSHFRCPHTSSSSQAPSARRHFLGNPRNYPTVAAEPRLPRRPAASSLSATTLLRAWQPRTRRSLSWHREVLLPIFRSLHPPPRSDSRDSGGPTKIEADSSPSSPPPASRKTAP